METSSTRAAIPRWHSERTFPSSLSIDTVRNGWLTLGDQGVVSASNFVTGVLIGRFCTKDAFGLYMLGLSIILFLMELQTALISTPYMVYSPRLEGYSLHLYNGSSLIHQVTLSGIVVILLVGGGIILSLGFGPSGFTPVIWALVATIGFILFKEFVRRFSFAGLRMRTAFIFDVCIGVTQIGGLLLLAKFGFLSPSGAFWVIGLACGVVGITWLIMSRAEFILQWDDVRADLANNWSFGKWVFASGVLWTFSMNLYPWLLTFFHGTASAGVWAACLGVLATANVPLRGAQNFLGPKIARVYASEGLGALRRMSFRAGALIGISMSLLAGLLLVLGNALLSFLYGAKYSGNGIVVFVLALSVAASGAAFAFSRALFAIERADLDFKINFIPLFVLFTFGFWLVATYGVLGAAVGLLLSSATAAGARCAVFVIHTHANR